MHFAKVCLTSWLLPLLIAFSCSVSTRIFAQADNDHFENATQLIGDRGTLEAFVLNATRQPGEPEAPELKAGSVWFRWVSPTNGTLELSRQSVGFPDGLQTVALFTGQSLSSLVKAVSTLNSDFPFSRLRTSVAKGQVLWIAVGGEGPSVSSSPDRLTLAYRVDPLPQNDISTRAFVLTGDDIEWDVRASGGTSDALEQSVDFPPNTSVVWYRWTSPSRAVCTLRLNGEFIPANAQIFRRNSNQTLQKIQIDAPFTFTTAAGTTYWIAIEETSWRPMRFRLMATYLLSMEGFVNNAKELPKPQDFVFRSSGYLPQDQISSYMLALSHPLNVVLQTNRVADYVIPSIAPGQYTVFIQATTTSGRNYGLAPTLLTVRLPNDRFEQRTELQGIDLLFDADLRGATADAIDPVGMPSAWWRWRAPFSGRLVLEPSFQSPVIDARIFRWSSESGLSLVNRDEIQEGQEYAIAFYDAQAGNRFNVRLALVHNEYPHDQFDQRKLIASTPFVERLRSDRLSAETGEPAGYYGNAASRTAWYTFSSIEEGNLTVGTVANAEQIFNYDSSFAGEVYRGTELTNLTLVSSLSRPNSFRVLPGETYQIRAVCPPYDTWQQPLFYCAFHASPTNDWFATAQTLTGTHLSVRTTLDGTSTETNEPPLQPVSGLAARRSIWFRWKAPREGNVAVFVQRNAPTNAIVAAPVIQMYRAEGSDFSGLIPLAPAPLPEIGSSFTVAAGQTYAIRVADHPAKPSTNSSLVLELHLAEVEAAFEGSNGVVSLANPKELVVTNAGIRPEGLTHYLKLYSPDPTLVEGATQGWGRFPLHTIQESGAFSFTTWNPGRYWLAIVASNQWGELAYSRPLALVLQPGNDDFSNSFAMLGSATNAWVATATVESGEPLLGQTYTNGTIWFHWTAPADGVATVQTTSSASVVVYEGDTLGQLTQVAPVQGSGSRISFYAVTGHRYQVQVATSAMPNPSQNRQITLTLGLVRPTLTWSPQPLPWVISAGTSVELSFDLAGRAENVADVWVQVGDQRLPAPTVPPFQVSFQSNVPGGFSAQAFMRLGSGFILSSPEITLWCSVTNGTAAAAVPLAGSKGLMRIEPPLGAGSTADFVSEQWFSWHSPATGAWFVEGAQVQPLPRPIELYRVDPEGNPVLIPYQSGYEPNPWMAYPVEAGVTYSIRVHSYPTEPSFVLPYSFETNPPNDTFANANPLVGSQFSADAFALLATTELGEDLLGHTPTRTLWWSWAAPQDGLLKLSVSRPHRFYLGDRLNGLTLQRNTVGNPGLGVYRVQAGRNYRIMVENEDLPATRVHLEGRLVSTPLNDAFAKAIVLSGRRNHFEGSLAGATAEPGEPSLTSPTAPTVWWTWTAPHTGEARFSLAGYKDYYSLSAFEGTKLLELTQLASGINEVRFTAIQGKPYYLRFASSVPEGADFSLRLVQATPPPNDSFASPERLAGSTAEASSWTYGATREFQEPWHGGVYGGRSSWFAWNPPSGGQARLRIEGAFFGLVGIYRGTELHDLAEVASVSGQLPLELAFDVDAGGAVLIAVDSANGESGDYRLSLGVAPPVQLHIVAASDQTLRLRGSGLPQKPVAVEHSEDLLEWVVWQTITPAEGTSEASIQLPPASEGRRFFRLREVR
ncbi:MAG: hypothetical protein JNN07_15455 [Verrucomicrobiales bacterium]|nr:hypothetical protein [Verrucomicrobiales bacterium]